MEKDIFSKISLISKAGLLSYNIMHINAMEKIGREINTNRNTDINTNNISNSIDIIYNNTINNFEEQEFTDNDYKKQKNIYDDALKLYKDNLGSQLDEYIKNSKKNDCEEKVRLKTDFFHNFIIFEKDIYNDDNLKKDIKDFHKILHKKTIIDYIKDNFQKKIMNIMKIESNFGMFDYTYCLKKSDYSKICEKISQKKDFFKKKIDTEVLWDIDKLEDDFNKCFNNNFGILKSYIKGEINCLISNIIEEDFKISEKLYNKEEKDLTKLTKYYFMFYSINFIINYFKENFPNIYNFQEKFQWNIGLDTFRIKEAKDYYTQDFDGKCSVFTKNSDEKYVPFSIYLNLDNIFEKTNLEIVTLVVHEFCHFIINTFTYTILKECEIEYKVDECEKIISNNKSEKNESEESDINFPKISKLENILFLKLIDNLKDSENFLNNLKKLKNKCYLSESYNKGKHLELLTCCLTDHIMNTVFNNINNFLQTNINDIKDDNKILENIKKQFHISEDEIHEKIKYNISCEGIFISSSEIGENLYKFLKDYDTNILEEKADDILDELERGCDIEEYETEYIQVNINRERD